MEHFKNNSIIFLNEFKILFIIVILLLLVSFFTQLSTENAIFDKSLQRHCLRITVGIFIALCVYRFRFRVWNDYAYLFYAIIFIALVIVEIIGTIKLGAQRWIDLYFFTFQPSELMKLSLILALSRYYSILSESEISELKNHCIPVLLTLLPVILVMRQPDLGTAGILLCTGIAMIFLSGFSQRVFFMLAGIGISTCPLMWYFLHDYQKKRIITFLDPDSDPLGSGYHILQSKIAIGSGGIFGKGYLMGTQSKLNFLPEKNTDFVFTTIAEESGFLGSFFVIFLLVCLMIYFFYVACSAKNSFAKLLCTGLGILLFLHTFINIAMVMGLVPVVGIPLPFISYGGSSMVTFMISCGLIMSAMAYRKS